MTKTEALQKAQDKATRNGRTYLVIHRPDHPVVGDWTYVIAADEKHAWTATETLVATVAP